MILNRYNFFELLKIKSWSSDRRVIFHHIHKTAGTSLEGLLAKWFLLQRDYDLVKEINSRPLFNINCRSGHYGYKKTKLSSSYPCCLDDDSFFVFTFLRNPLERTISHYHHWQKAGFEGLQEISLEDFLLQKSNYDWVNSISNNWMARVLDVNESDYKKNLDKYAFIGIFEDLKESIEILSKLLDKPIYQMPHKRKSEKKELKVSKEIKEIFINNNKLDYAIYEYGLKRLKR